MRRFEEVFKILKYNKSNFNKSINAYDSSSVIFGKSPDGLNLNELTSFLSAMALSYLEGKIDPNKNIP